MAEDPRPDRVETREEYLTRINAARLGGPPATPSAQPNTFGVVTPIFGLVTPLDILLAAIVWWAIVAFRSANWLALPAAPSDGFWQLAVPIAAFSLAMHEWDSPWVKVGVIVAVLYAATWADWEGLFSRWDQQARYDFVVGIGRIVIVGLFVEAFMANVARWWKVNTAA
jgi:hypothetical protein